MLTIFTIPKPFIGHIGVIQRNAIISWLHLVPECEIILFGDEPGIQEITQEFGIMHVPEIRKTRYGTPFLDDVFSRLSKSHTMMSFVIAMQTLFSSMISLMR